VILAALKWKKLAHFATVVFEIIFFILVSLLLSLTWGEIILTVNIISKAVPLALQPLYSLSY
jgi:hypothetical protein